MNFICHYHLLPWVIFKVYVRFWKDRLEVNINLITSLCFLWYFWQIGISLWLLRLITDGFWLFFAIHLQNGFICQLFFIIIFSDWQSILFVASLLKASCVITAIGRLADILISGCHTFSMEVVILWLTEEISSINGVSKYKLLFMMWLHFAPRLIFFVLDV